MVFCLIAISMNGFTAGTFHNTPLHKDMVLVPAGIFLSGLTSDQIQKLSETYQINPDLCANIPSREIELPAFLIDRFEVTNQQYREFTEATGYRLPLNWIIAEYPEERADHPVVGIDHADAGAYANWAGKRLPTEAEWEKAARGTDGRLWPWGNTWHPHACRMDDLQGRPMNPETSPVGSFGLDRSIYGVMDMAGNVPEYVDGARAEGFEYCIITKGGGFIFSRPWQFVSALHIGHPGGNGSMLASKLFNQPYSGFRCAMDLPDDFPNKSMAQTDTDPYQRRAPWPLSRESHRPQPPDPGIYLKENIRILPTRSVESIRDAPPGDPRRWPDDFTPEEIRGEMTLWMVEVRVPYFPDDRFGVMLECYWQWNSPVQTFNFSPDFTHVEYTTQKEDWEMHARLRVETGLDSIDIIFDCRNNGPNTVSTSQEMCLSLAGAPNFRDHDGVRTLISTDRGLKSMEEIWHHVNDRIYCQNHMLPSSDPSGRDPTVVNGPFISTRSRDGEWLVCPVVLTGPPNRLFNNREYSCLHCNPDSSIPAGGSRLTHQRIYFLKGDMDDLALRYENDINTYQDLNNHDSGSGARPPALLSPKG